MRRDDTSGCTGRCRVRGAVPARSPQCRAPEDCGARPHTQAMQCVGAGVCVSVCEPHWGDCNQDYRDGCEQAIAHPHYCEGDPRIGEVTKPMALFVPDGPSLGLGRFDANLFEEVLGRHTPQLEACYRAALSSQPALRATFAYELTVDEAGELSAVRRTLSGQPHAELEACVKQVLAGIRFDCGAEGGSVTFPYSATFIPGGEDAPAQ